MMSQLFQQLSHWHIVRVTGPALRPPSSDYFSSVLHKIELSMAYAAAAVAGIFEYFIGFIKINENFAFYPFSI